jgi:hypothetical protein
VNFTKIKSQPTIQKMELVSSISATAVAAIIITQIYDMVKSWYYSDPVQQVVNMTLMVRDSLHPLVLNSIKHIVLVVAQALHLVIHVVAQALITVKYVYHIVIMVGKGIFVALRSFNTAFEFVWAFPETYLNPLIDWFFAHPVPTYSWRMTFFTLLAVSFGFYLFRRILKKVK